MLEPDVLKRKLEETSAFFNARVNLIPVSSHPSPLRWAISASVFRSLTCACPFLLHQPEFYLTRSPEEEMELAQQVCDLKQMVSLIISASNCVYACVYMCVCV